MSADNAPLPTSTPPAPPVHERALPVALLLLAGPIVAALISRTAMGLVDFIMVSQLGTEAQAAILPAGITLFTAIAFGMGTISAVNTLVAQHAGRRENLICTQYTWQGLWLSAGLGVGAVALWPVAPWLFEAAGHEPAVMAMEIPYVQIGLLGVGPILASVAVANFFNGIHRPMIGLWATVVSNVFNVAANYALIFGHLGFEAMGIAGAAWATTLASGVNLLVLAVWWVRPTMQRTYAVGSAWRFQKARMARLLRIGLPAGVHFSTDVGAFAVFTLWLIGRLGTTELAANNIAMKFWEIAIIPCVGIGMAVSSAVGRAIGEQRPDRARRFAHWGNGFGLAYLAVTAVGFLVWGHGLIATLTEDAQVAHRTWQLLCVAIIALGFDSVQIIYSSALRGAGDTFWPAVAAPVAAGVVLLGGGYGASVVWPQGGAVGPWLALGMHLLVLTLLWVPRFVRGRWETLDATGDEDLDHA